MKTDIYEIITNKIVTLIENGVGECQLPWRKTTQFEFPKNVASLNPYRGINTLTLWCTEIERGYSSGLWGTYKQWASLGAQVKKGEKGSPIVFWKTFEKAADDRKSDQKEESKKTALVVNYSSVFNAEQVDNFKEEEKPEENRDGGLEEFFFEVGADIRQGGDKAFFAVSEDFVQMPFFNAFNSSEDYYSVLSHELTHWTGDSKRLNREFGKTKNDEVYAFEELIAELGSAFLCATLGISQDPRQEHAHYLDSWLKMLKGDKKAIFKAASKAQAAADYLREKGAMKLAA